MEAAEAPRLPRPSTLETLVGQPETAAASLSAARPLLGGCADERAGSGLRVNGFRTIAEPAMVVIQEENIAPLSMPPEIESFQPTPESITKMYKSGKVVRLIHDWSTLDAQERQALEQMRCEAEQLGYAFFPRLALAANRFLCEFQGDVDRAFELILKVQEHRAMYYANGPIVDASIQSDLNLGVITVCGRDAAMRPIMVVRPARAPLDLCNDLGADRLVRCVNFIMEYCRDHMWYLGKVESCVLIFDVGGLKLSQVPFKSFQRITAALNMQPPCSIGKIFVCRMSFMLRQVGKLANASLSEQQQAKVMFVTHPQDLFKFMSADQVEKDFGGNRENITRFFPFDLRPGSFAPTNAFAGTSASSVDTIAIDAEVFHDTLDEAFWEGIAAMPSSAAELARRQELPVQAPSVERFGCCRRRCGRCWRICDIFPKRQVQIELLESRDFRPREALPPGQAFARYDNTVTVRVDHSESEATSFHSAVG